MSKINNDLKINWTVFIVLFIYPALIITGVVFYSSTFGTTSFEWILAIVAYYASNISVGIGLHRLWTHNSYKINKIFEFFLMLLSSGTLQGPAIAWASDHDLHHRYTDEDSDPHSPLKYTNKIKGFLWSHVGWMLFSSTHKTLEMTTMKRLGKNKTLMFQLKHYWSLAMFMNLVAPLMLGFIIGGDLQSAIAAYLFIGLGRAIQQEVTFCVNSLCHFMGSKKYLNGTAGDIYWMFFLLLGENFHNFHHAFARDYRNGWKWHHPDVHKWIIYIMSKCGLAHDLVITPKERIMAKQAETKLQLETQMHQKLTFIESTALKIADSARQKLQSIEKSAGELAGNVHEKLVTLENKANQLVSKMQKAMTEYTLQSQKKVLVIASKKIAQLEALAIKTGIMNYNIEKNASI